MIELANAAWFVAGITAGYSVGYLVACIRVARAKNNAFLGDTPAIAEMAKSINALQKAERELSEQDLPQ